MLNQASHELFQIQYQIFCSKLVNPRWKFPICLCWIVGGGLKNQFSVLFEIENFANSIMLLVFKFLLFITYYDDFIHGRYVLKKIRLAKHTEKSKLTSFQEVGWCNKFFHSLHISSQCQPYNYFFVLL
jgi:hypothetical protein